MSTVSEAFRGLFGAPDPAHKSGMPFDGESNGAGRIWASSMSAEIGAGFFMNRFLYLFGEELPKLQPCLKAWSFLIPDDGKERYVIGKNAYGSLLVIENPNADGLPPVGLLDTTTVEYWTEPDLVFGSLLGWWLPRKKLPNFFKSELYDKWAAKSKEPLEVDEILGMTVPLSLGGTWKASNFEVRDIVEYYETTGPTYKAAFDEMKKSKT